MAPLLRKLGNISFNYPWKFIGGWLIALVLLGATAVHFYTPPSSDISIPGTEAQKAIDRANQLFPGGGKGTGRIVFESPSGKKISDYQKQIDDLLRTVRGTDGVANVIGPFDQASFISNSGTIAYAQIQLKDASGATDKATLAKIQSDVSAARTEGLAIEMGGDLISRSPDEILGIGEVAGVAIALLVLILTLGSLIAAGMPILTALLGIGVSMAALFSMGQLFSINSTTPALAVMLGLAVGIDYALFIISKYRALLLSGIKSKEATGRALSTAGNAVVFAALTVVIALAALSIVNIPFMTAMGLAGAGSVAVAALVAITLIPALLRLAGEHVLTKKERARIHEPRILKLFKKSSSHSSGWFRWGEFIVAKPIPILLLAVVLIGFIAWPAKDLQLGLPSDQYAAETSTERRAYDILSKGFGVGFNGPLTVVVEGLPPVSDADKDTVRQQALAEYAKRVQTEGAKQQALFAEKAQQATTLEQQLALQQEITQAQTAGAAMEQQAVAQIESSVGQYAKFVQLQKVATNIAALDGVKEAQPAAVTDSGTAGIIQVIPASAPASTETATLINNLRARDIQTRVSGSDTISLAVTGSTALQEDISAKLAAALPQYLAVVVGLSLILLVIAFRSIIIPLKATLGFLLSVAAMFGAMVAVFQWGWFGITDAPGPLVSFIPIIAIGILFGLAMDYEFFLVSGMHEAYTHKKDARAAIVQGFGVGSKVVTAAGIIMVSVFAGFIFNHDATIQAMGFGLAVGILVDAFLVRMTIVPAVMTLLGKSAWWLPKWLDKRLPHVSIEGEEK